MKKVAIICTLDGFANSNKPNRINKYLLKKGCQVEMINTIKINSLVFNDRARTLTPGLFFVLLVNRLVNICLVLLDRYLQRIKKYIYYYLLRISMKCRAYLLNEYLKYKKFDLIIGESQIDSEYFLYNTKPKTFYGCATPWADELYFGGEITEKQYKKFLSLEIKIYKSVDFLSFHWETYGEYVKKYFYNGNNIMILNSGSDLKKYHAQYSENPKIVYMGYLGGYWINLPLLSRLSKLYKNIDVYGGPPPPISYGLNYKGYASSEVLKDYQFGLITISKDRLRREGFSAKHLEYLSYGLPVFVPDWRPKAKDLKGSILYNEENFLDLINKYKKKEEWHKISQIALQQSKAYSWDKILKPLDTILEKI